MSSEDFAYYSRRAEEEIARAYQAREPAVRRAHALLAGYYLDRIHSQPEKGGGTAMSRGPAVDYRLRA